MRPRTLTAIGIAALALGVPVAITQAAPKTVEVAFSFDGPSARVTPVDGRDGTYTMAARLWSTRQRVHWFTAGPPAVVGSMPVTTFAALLARHATAGGATAPVAHISFVQGGAVKDFLATVSVADARIGPKRAPVHTTTLSPIAQDRMQQIAGGSGLLAGIATGCLTRGCRAIGGTHAANQKYGPPQFGVGNCAGQPKSCLGWSFYMSLRPRFYDNPGWA